LDKHEFRVCSEQDSFGIVSARDDAVCLPAKDVQHDGASIRHDWRQHLCRERFAPVLQGKQGSHRSHRLQPGEHGNGSLQIALNALQVILYPGTYFYYRWRNMEKAKKWDALSAEQRKEYLDTTSDVGNKR
jgi:hypothetical protein